MTYAEATHLNRAIRKCVTRCHQSSEPYRELSDFIGDLREGGVSEHYIQAINRAALRDIAAKMVANAGEDGGMPEAVSSYGYILQ